MSFISSIVGFFKKVLSFIKKILPLIIIVAIVFAPALAAWFSTIGWTTMGSALAAIGTTLAPIGFWGSLAVAVGISAIVSPKATSEVIGAVADAAGDIISGVGSAVGDGIGGLVGSLFSSPVVLIGCGVLAWYLLSDRNTSEGSSQHE